MAAAPLTSNHVNYLIWRYLQESGHDRTAARLQRDWKIGDPETLPFARHIKTHALVSLVQKGLQYHELENSLQANGERATQTPTALFFGTESADAPRTETERPTGLRAPSPRKHGRDSLLPNAAHEATGSGPAPKRRRAPGRTTPAKSGDEMDVDRQRGSSAGNEAGNDAESASRRQSDGTLANGTLGDSEQSASGVTADGASAAGATAVEPPAAPTPVIPTLETGRSVLTQTDSIAQLRNEWTKMLELGQGKRVLKTVWNPQQPNVLASAGDGVCRIWSVPSFPSDTNGAAATDAAPPATQPTPQHTDLFKSVGKGMDDATITAIAWSPDGDYLAAARHPNSLKEASSVSLFDKDGAESLQLGRGQRFFFGLAFNPSGNLLLGHGGDNTHYSDDTRDYGLCVWDVSSPDQAMAVATSTASRQIVTGAVWVDDKTIMVCGPGYIATTVYENKSLQPLQELTPTSNRVEDPNEPTEWTFMEYDRFTGACILAAEYAGRLALLSPDRRQMHEIEAHSGEIKGIQLQPLPQHGSSGEGPRFLASASMDGSVKIWNIADNDLVLHKTLHCNSFEPAREPGLAMQFSPDGGYLAVATASKVSFWRPERVGAWPAAEWSLEQGQTGWRDGAAAIKNENDTRANGGNSNGNNSNTATVNGVNGHAQSNGVTVNGTTGPVVNEADRMSIDGEETRSALEDLEEQAQPALLAWSAKGKKLAYGHGAQIAVGDFTSIGRT